MFKHDFWTFQSLNEDYINGERHYVTPDGMKLPSVTTILSRLSADSIKKWRERVGAEEANRVSTQAARRGTAIHHICEQYLLNNPDYKKGVMPINLDTFKTIQPYIDQYISTVHGLEVPLYSKKLHCAGRTDCIAVYRDKLSIVDFKTSRKSKKEEWILNYFLQATCYALMAEELFQIDIPQVVIIIAVDNESPQVFRRNKAKYIDQVKEIFHG